MIYLRPFIILLRILTLPINCLVPDSSIYLIELFINQIAGSEQSTLTLNDDNKSHQ